MVFPSNVSNYQLTLKIFESLHHWLPGFDFNIVCFSWESWVISRGEYNWPVVNDRHIIEGTVVEFNEFFPGDPLNLTVRRAALPVRGTSKLWPLASWAMVRVVRRTAAMVSEI